MRGGPSGTTTTAAGLWLWASRWFTTARAAPPRAAVSTVVQWTSPSSSSCRYLVIQRGTPPHVGQWSLPGGKLEPGETAWQGAYRELHEEVQLVWPHNTHQGVTLAWHPYAFTASDAVGSDYHYLIAQCFCRVVVPHDNDNDRPPVVHARDDALAAQWVSLDDITCGSTLDLTPGVDRVVPRAHALSHAGWLDCPTTTTYADSN